MSRDLIVTEFDTLDAEQIAEACAEVAGDVRGTSGVYTTNVVGRLLATVILYEAAASRLVEVEKVMRDAAFNIARTGHWMLDSAPMTKKQAARELGRIAKRLDPNIDPVILGNCLGVVANETAKEGAA